jgi:hypothetical protein
MKRLLTVMMIGLLYGIGLAGCGNDAGVEAVLVMPTDATSTTSISAGIGTFDVGGLLIKVVKSTTEPTIAVPDVKIELQPFAANGTTLLYSDFLHTHLVASSALATSWKTTTDSNGTLLVYARFAAGLSCPTSTGGEMGFTAIISADAQVWTGTLTIECT